MLVFGIFELLMRVLFVFFCGFMIFFGVFFDLMIFGYSVFI